ncbi:MAG: hypothetical protein Q9195_005626, partial [Heterodermia aff. obscurata]
MNLPPQQPSLSQNSTLHASPNCQADYGIGLNKASCQQALQLLPTAYIRRSYGPRDAGPVDVLVPRRYLS